jgi:hypothetical protein
MFVFIRKKNKILTENDLKILISSLVQILDEYGKRYFSWDSVLDETLKKDIVNIEFSKYINETDIFDSIFKLVKSESREKIFKWVFNETSKVIRESNSL